VHLVSDFESKELIAHPIDHILILVLVMIGSKLAML
jgi:hypothetical protein